MGRTHDDIAAISHHARDALGLQVGAVADPDLAWDHGGPIEPLALRLVGQLEGREAFVVESPDAMHAPHATSLAARTIGLGDHDRIDDPDRTRACQSSDGRRD